MDKLENCKIDNCLKCEFKDDYSNKNSNNVNHYYLSSQTCKSCYDDVDISNGYYFVCSVNEIDLESAILCNCNTGYVLTENKDCSFFNEKCINCILGDEKLQFV